MKNELTTILMIGEWSSLRRSGSTTCHEVGPPKESPSGIKMLRLDRHHQDHHGASSSNLVIVFIAAKDRTLCWMFPSYRPARTTPNKVSSTKDTSSWQFWAVQVFDNPQFEATALARAMNARIDSPWFCFWSRREMRCTAEWRVVTARDFSLSSSLASVSKVVNVESDWSKTRSCLDWQCHNSSSTVWPVMAVDLLYLSNSALKKFHSLSVVPRSISGLCTGAGLGRTTPWPGLTAGVDKKQENSFFSLTKNFAVHLFLGQTLPLPP